MIPDTAELSRAPLRIGWERGKGLGGREERKGLGGREERKGLGGREERKRLGGDRGKNKGLRGQGRG